jgi:hypothetical protein
MNTNALKMISKFLFLATLLEQVLDFLELQLIIAIKHF